MATLRLDGSGAQRTLALFQKKCQNEGGTHSFHLSVVCTALVNFYFVLISYHHQFIIIGTRRETILCGQRLRRPQGGGEFCRKAARIGPKTARRRGRFRIRRPEFGVDVGGGSRAFAVPPTCRGRSHQSHSRASYSIVFFVYMAIHVGAALKLPHRRIPHPVLKLHADGFNGSR